MAQLLDDSDFLIEQEDFFSQLNRSLTLSESRNVTPIDLRRTSTEVKACGGSPQSIFGGIGSWSGRSSNESYKSPIQSPSPPASPYEAEYNAAGLIYAAASQIERLKMRNEGQFMAEANHMPSVQNHKPSFMAEQNYLAAARRAYIAALVYEKHLQNLSDSAKYKKLLACETPYLYTLHDHRNPVRVSTKSSYQAAPMPKKESVGTGVFLPRVYNSSPAVPPRKRAMATNAHAPGKVGQELIGYEDINSCSQPYYTSNAFLSQRRVARADAVAQGNHEVLLPQEWSY